jgi:hypothetical protein
MPAYQDLERFSKDPDYFGFMGVPTGPFGFVMGAFTPGLVFFFFCVASSLRLSVVLSAGSWLGVAVKISSLHIGIAGRGPTEYYARFHSTTNAAGSGRSITEGPSCGVPT